MTFYQFVHGELHKRASKCRETKTQWVLTFTNEVWPYEIRFPKLESKQFTALYAYALYALSQMVDTDRDRGLAIITQAYDKEESEYHAPFENPKPR